MFITLQFPLFDHRYLLADASRTQKPDWPTPQERDRIRYFGQVISRNKDTQKEYKGPWDDEKKYCNARSVIDLCGTEKQYFYQQLHQSAYCARILFRRFQSDGKCLAKFEIGFTDEFEKTLDTSTLNRKNLSTLLFAHIERYLLCPVKIRVGSKLTGFVPLIDAGRHLTNAYFWATTKGKKTFLPKDIQNKVEYCEPAILVQVDNEHLEFKEFQQIKTPELAKEKIQLYHQLIPYTIGRYNFRLKAWIISLPQGIYSNPAHKREFSFYNDTLRYLRINLLRIHVETVIQQKFLTLLGRQQTEQPVTDQQTVLRLYKYMHKVLLNLSGIMRNKQPQELLVQAAFRLEEMYAGAQGIEKIVEELKYYMVWLKTLSLTEETKQVIAYSDKLIAEMEHKNIAEKNGRTVFISYNHKDETTAKLLKKKLEAKGIRVILDSDAMKAGTGIDEFIGESLRAAQATIGVISRNSLLSGWVAIETVNMLSFEKLFKGKTWIACCLDEDFMQENFVDESVKALRKKYAKTGKQIQQHLKADLGITDLQDEYDRTKFLKDNLARIVGKLKKTLYIPVAGRQLNKNFQKIMDAVVPDAV